MGPGLGKALRSTVHPLRPDIPVLLGAEGPKNVALAGEIADGWIPLWFSPTSDAFYRTALREGFSRPGARRSLDDFEVAAVCPIVEDDDVERAARRIKPLIAFYAGGMGAKGANFHNDVFVRMGWGEACREIQDLYLTGRRDDAAAAVPTAMVEDVALVGPVDKICEEVERRWHPSCVTTMILAGWPRRDTRERILAAVRG